MINFRGDLVNIENDKPCRIDNTMESIEELCELVKQFIDKSDVTRTRYSTYCSAYQDASTPRADTATQYTTSPNSH